MSYRQTSTMELLTAQDVATAREAFRATWDADPSLALQALLYIRDYRFGLGSKDVALQLVRELRALCPDTYRENMARLYEQHGCFKDLLKVATTVDNCEMELEFFKEILEEDLEAMNRGDPVSLAAKWAPTEGTRYHGLAKLLARRMFPKHPRALQLYRLEVLSPLRRYLGVTESKMCAGEWEAIDTAMVPAKARRLYGRAFDRHGCPVLPALRKDPDLPHELVQYYLDKRPYDGDVGMRWRRWVHGCSDKLTNSVAVVDPCSAACIALGLLVAEANGMMVVPFHAPEELVQVKGDSLQDQVAFMKMLPRLGSIDLVSLFSMLLQKRPETETVYIFADRELSEADALGLEPQTAFEIASGLFRIARRAAPKLVVWHPKAPHPRVFPVTRLAERMTEVRGMSRPLLEAFVEGTPMEPEPVMRTLLAKIEK
jgi:hypothetical protein